MIAYQSTEVEAGVKLEDSNGLETTSGTLSDLLNFLLEPHSGQFRVAWDLEQFVAPIIGRLSNEYMRRLFTTGQVWIRETGHSITYNPKKSLYLTLGSNRAKYYHLSQFYNGGARPQNLLETKTMGETLLAELKTIGIEPTKLTSPVVAIDSLWDKISYPNYKELPELVGQMAWDCCEKPWVEARQIGWWDNAYDVDIVSSFPSSCANLLDLRYGKWVKSNTIPDKAHYGFARGRIKITGKVSPIIYTNKNGKLYNPVGEWDTILSLQEMRFIVAYDIGSFTIQEGVWWIPAIKYTPFKKLVNDLYSYRSKSPILNYVIKKSLVGLYGKWLQTFRDGTLSDRFNSVYGAMIEIPIRLKIAQFILDNKLEDNVIHISTDGILLDKRVELKSDAGLGEWRNDSNGEALVVSSGCLFYGDKRPNQITYKEAMTMIKQSPNDAEWERSSKRLYTMGDVVDSANLSRIGKVMPIVVGFGLKGEHDRWYANQPDSGVELLSNHYKSEPLDASELSVPVKRGE